MNCRPFLLFCWLLASITNGATSQPATDRVVSYDVEATIHSFRSVDVSLICVVRKTDTVSAFEFLFSSSARVQSVQGKTDASWLDIPFKFSGGDTLRLALPPPLHTRDTLTLKFTYSFPGVSESDSLLMLDRGHRWYPLIVDQVARMKLAVDVSHNCTVISAGNLIASAMNGDRATFVWQSTMPVFKLPLIVFRTDAFRKTSRSSHEKAIDLYSLSIDTVKAERVLEEAGKVFTFCRSTIGEYAHDRLTLIETPRFEGINIGSGLLTVGSLSLAAMGRGEFESLHLTVAQQWFGAGVFAKFGQPGFWFLSISLPHYVRLMYLRQANSEAAYREALEEPLKKYRLFAGKEVDIPIIDVGMPDSREKGLVLYAKGPFVISKLHALMGDQRWQMFLQHLYRDYRGRLLTYESFGDSISQSDSTGMASATLDRSMRGKGMPEE